MLKNIPSSQELDEISLRLYFDAWRRMIRIVSNFGIEYGLNEWSWESCSSCASEWSKYLEQAQSELNAIAATAQQSAEIRLKAIICETSPYILLLKSDVKLTASGHDLDFTDQRTLDAIDLPAAVRCLTPFPLPDNYINSYHELRRLRNKVVHTGTQKDLHFKFPEFASILGKQYAALWPDGRWLFRRVMFDGHHAVAYFHDGRYSSVYTDIMEEFPITVAVFDNTLFKKCVGTSKSSLKGHCPVCKSHTASKLGSDTQPTS